MPVGPAGPLKPLPRSTLHYLRWLPGLQSLKQFWLLK